jgi:hypothetical protein
MLNGFLISEISGNSDILFVLRSISPLTFWVYKAISVFYICYCYIAIAFPIFNLPIPSFLEDILPDYPSS